MRPALAIVVAALGVFTLPWQAAALLLLASSVALPVSGALLGIAADILYFSPGAGPVPWFAIAGVASSAAGLLVRRYMKERIMD